MSPNALYYPHVHVPEDQWFTRVLLYWDRVGAIVPYDYVDQPERLGTYMQALVREGLVEQVIPGGYLWRVPNFTGAFLRHTDAKFGRRGEPYQSDWATRHSETLRGVPVHMEKLFDLAEKLCERGMATRDNRRDDSPWIFVEPRVATDFMAYLAGVLGQLTDAPFAPITNERASLEPFFEQTGKDRRVEVREQLLERVLPAPERPLEAVRLREFKEAYKDQFSRFRKQLEENVSEIATIRDERLQQMRLNDITKSLQEEIGELTARMDEQRNWPRIDFCTLCAVLGSGLTAAKAVAQHDLALGLTGAGLSLAPAIYSAFKGSDSAWVNRPLAYAVLARSHLK